MNKRIVLVIFIVAALLGKPGKAVSYLVGARSLSMGNAFAGQADDVSAIFINPSGLSQLKSFNLNSFYSHLSSGFDFTSIAAARPGPFGGVVGVGYQANILPNFQISGETLSYTEQEFHLAYSKRVAEDLALGANFRHIEHGFSKDLPSLRDSVGSGTAADFSLKYFYQPWFNIGICAQNIGKKLLYADGAEKESPVNLVFGLNYKIFGENSYYEGRKQDLTANFDLSKEGNSPLLMHLGFEWSPLKNFSLRIGSEQTPRTQQENYTHITGGIGLKLGGITLDYAVYRSGDPSQAMTYFFSLGYVESLEPLTAETTAVLITSSPSPEPVVVRAVKRNHFSDVPAGHPARDAIELLATAEMLYGYPDGTFRPEEKVTREEFCAILVHAKHLATPEVKTMLDLGAVLLYPDKTFKPERPISRAEAIYALAVLEKLAIPRKIDKAAFADVLPSAWSAPAIEAALNAGLIVKEKYFYPNQPLTRAALSQMIFNTSFGKAAVKRLPRLED